MNSYISVLVHDKEFRIDYSVFPGGEVNVRLPEGVNRGKAPYAIEAVIRDSDGVMALLMTKDAIDRSCLRGSESFLLLHYVPYGRQDRVCNKGEALSVKVFANLVNGMKFSKVVISDPHSDVTPALIDNCEVDEQFNIVKSKLFWRDIKSGALTVVSPDIGAAKKTEKLGVEFVQGLKHRNPETGQLSGFSYIGDVTGKRLIIVDDICDGGGTFVGLAKVLIDGGALSVDLYVTHGIFSKGKDVLTSNGIRNIYTRKSS